MTTRIDNVWSSLLQSWLGGGAKHTTPTVDIAPARYDAFARLRISQPVTLFDSQMQYDKNPLLWDESGDGTVTYTQATASCGLGVAAGESILRQSRAYHRYQPGKSQLIILTGILGTETTGVTKRIGYYDANDGVFFEQDADGVNFVVRNAGNDTAVAQADWNLSVVSDADWTKAQIFIIDVEWLGVGRVRAGLFRNGVPVYVHQVLNDNVASNVYMTTANLPVRYEIVSTTGVASDLKQICASVISEGGFEEERGYPFSTSVSTVSIGTAGFVPVMALRSGTAFAGTVARGQILPESIDVYCSGNPIQYKVMYGGTVAGGSWGAVYSGTAMAEINTTGTAHTGGFAINGGYVPATGNNPVSARGSDSKTFVSKLPLALDVAGTVPIELTLTAQGIGGTGTAYATVNWRELR